MGRATGSWLSGPQIGGGPEGAYRGEDLGLSESGPGSIATGWPRVAALLVDWLLAGGVTLLFVRFGSPTLGTWVLVTWFIIGVISVTLFGFTPGQFALGLRTARVDYGPDRTAAEIAGEVPIAAVGIVRTLARQILIVFIVPALMNDYNSRALHDRATGTAIIRSR
ncbi:RDD family protein [Gordonia sp. CPCC 205515]|uniref:RDD family protein n=1 Tax=Gordonia sp. CPCC 205515 TaxID=3140791 RepID=UPI003AF3480E